MFEGVRTFVYNRRRGIATTVGFVGGFYLAARYVMERLEEIREQVVQEKTARENLRRRFRQNQQDCTYTILALVPTLGDKILEEMDVESVTLKLQMQSKAAKSRMQTLSSSASEVNTSSLSLNTDQPSITSSIELSMPSPARVGFDSESSQSHIGSAQSWVEQFTADHSSSAPSEIDQSLHDGPPAPSSPTSSSGAHLSDSVTSASASLVSATNSERVSQLIESLHSVRSDYINSHPAAPNEDASLTTKSKAELWREVKILTFTRTLTILYSTTLLSLLTHIQLNLLGRYKYVQSVLEMEREQKLKERQSLQATLTNLFWNAANISNSSSSTSLLNEEIGSALGLFGNGQTGHTERKYLTLSWWLLNVGWREVGDRVRVAVEAIFDEVSLKAKLGMEDLERLIKDTRQKVEFSHSQQSSNTVQDASALPPRRISFLPSLIPVTPEGLKDVLEKGGLPPHLTDIDDTAFLQLVEDTREFISSADFGQVLETCLDHASDILFDGLRRMVFPDGASTEGPSHLDKIRLAGMLPGVARWSHAAIYGTPNEIVEGLAEVRELAGFSAIIYSSYADTFR
ncbi:hypothetical protein Clacol_008925 [Clathrus columnatus]|uniref:Peroxisomal biogenesis factor 3 n=1 Tax=Clathrus columnatus TaxID=1419009 RepID=A0AAV5AND7_9AGAM|nr:hypothetical protein Clacol_008925 [Clathrus columnatus]